MLNEWIADFEWIVDVGWIVDVEWMKDYCELMNAYSYFHESFKMNNDPQTNKLMFKTDKKLNLIWVYGWKWKYFCSNENWVY